MPTDEISLPGLEAVIVLAEWGDPYDRNKSKTAREELRLVLEVLRAAEAIGGHTAIMGSMPFTLDQQMKVIAMQKALAALRSVL